MAIDWTKPIETRDGRKAELRCTFDPPLSGGYTRGIVITKSDGARVFYLRQEGGVEISGGGDLRNVPEPPKFMDMAMRFVVVDTRNGRIECTMDTEEKAKSFVGTWGPTFVVARLPAKLEVV